MSSVEDAQQALVDAIELIGSAINGGNASAESAKNYSIAAKQLAEAHAWLQAPAQPHG